MLKIYGVPISVHTRKVVVVALHKDLPHEVVPVVPVIPDNLPPDWRELSPTGKIPVLTDGDFTVGDSSAICAYLERTHPDRRVYPQSARDYACALSLEQYAGTLFNNVVHPLFAQTLVNPRIRHVPTDRGKVDEVLARAVPETFGYLDRIAGDGFLVGGDLSIADIAVASNLVTYQYLGFDLYRTRFPRLATLYDRIVRQPAMREALRRERPVAASMNLRGEFLAPVLA